MENKMQAINGIIEPDFLQYLTQTFKDWKKLYEEKTALGTREIAKLQWIVYGAKCNAHIGFEVHSIRSFKEETGQEHFSLWIFKNKEEMEAGKPLYTFDAPIYK